MRLHTLVACTFLAFSSAAIAAVNDLAIVGATLVDVRDAGRSNGDRQDVTILIRNGLVTEVGDRAHVALPSGIRVIDASGRFAVPGLIDGFGSLRSQGFADAYLYEGVTTVFVYRSPVGGDGEQVIADVRGGPRLLRGATLSGYSADGAMPSAHPWTDHRLHDRPLSDAELVAEIDGYADRGIRGLVLGLDVLPHQFDVILGEAARRHLATIGEPEVAKYEKRRK